MRNPALSTAIVISLAANAIGQSPRTATTAAPSLVSAPTVLAQLDARIADVSFQDAPLDQIFGWLAELTPMSVTPRWRTLEYAGVERDQPITLEAHNLRLSQLLWLILEEAGGPDLNLAYQASDNLLIISTEEDLKRTMLVKVYDAADLAVRVPDFRDAPHISLDQSSAGPFSGAQASGREGYDPGEKGAGDAQQIADVIVETIEPDSWSSNGGSGAIRVFRDLLIVRNSVFVHQEIGGLIQTDH